MPVSKKRKKQGKPVQRPALSAEKESAAEQPEAHSLHTQTKSGKPKNPFVSHQPQLRGSQRGR
jgi:hypothetical protein